jgi:hypothetical protein
MIVAIGLVCSTSKKAIRMGNCSSTQADEATQTDPWVGGHEHSDCAPLPYADAGGSTVPKKYTSSTQKMSMSANSQNMSALNSSAKSTTVAGLPTDAKGLSTMNPFLGVVPSHTHLATLRDEVVAKRALGRLEIECVGVKSTFQRTWVWVGHSILALPADPIVEAEINDVS